MRALMADNNVEGHLDILVQVLLSREWRELWTSLSLGIVTFEDLGLLRTVLDIELWQACQRHQVLLITANRNRRGEDSLEAAIRTLNTPASLPVFTLANPKRLEHDKTYAARAAVNLLQYLLDIDNYRGTGRLYLP